MPIHYLYRSFSTTQVVALYRAADVMLVTPLRDGMNLVAKEFVAARTDEDGVLVLSEFAGAAAELGEALLVNPYDIDGMASAYKRASRCRENERRERMRALRERVRRTTCTAGRSRSSTPSSAAHRRGRDVSRISAEDLHDVIATHRRGAALVVLLLDYDGTLVPFANTPELAVPPEGLMELLRALAERQRTRVHSSADARANRSNAGSARFRIALHAEHGVWSRPRRRTVAHRSRNRLATGRSGSARSSTSSRTRTPGSRVEEKIDHVRVALPHGRSGVRPEPGAGALGSPHRHLHATRRSRCSTATRSSRSASTGLQGHRRRANLGDARGRTAHRGHRRRPHRRGHVRRTTFEWNRDRVGAGPSNARYRLADPAAVLAFLLAIIDQKTGTVAAES